MGLQAQRPFDILFRSHKGALYIVLQGAKAPVQLLKDFSRGSLQCTFEAKDIMLSFSIAMLQWMTPRLDYFDHSFKIGGELLLRQGVIFGRFGTWMGAAMMYSNYLNIAV